MRRTLMGVIGVICFVSVTIRTVVAQAPGSDGVLPIFVDYAQPPTTLSQASILADAIVDIRIESRRFESPMDQRIGRAHDVTKYNVRVVDTLKPHVMLPPVQGMLTITRLGGQHIEGGKLVASAVRGFEDFKQNAEYVLFLTWNQHTNEFDIAFGPNGSFELLSSGTVRPLGHSELASGQQDKGRASFLRELRVAAVR